MCPSETGQRLGNVTVGARSGSGWEFLARPEGLEHALPTIVVEGVAESVEFLRAA
jgi:hypothetical protein